MKKKQIEIPEDKMVTFIPEIEIRDCVSHKIIKEPDGHLVIKDKQLINKPFNSIQL